MKREIHSTLWALGGIFLALSLFSYKSDDPGFFSDTSGIVAKNMCGILGAYISDLLIAFMGIGVFLLPLGVVKVVVNIYKEDRPSWLSTSTIAFLNIWLVSSIAGIDFKTFNLFGETYPAGGVLGSLISSFLVSYLNQIGAYLFLAGLFVLSVLSLIHRQSFVFNGEAIISKLQTLFKREAKAPVLREAKPARKKLKITIKKEKKQEKQKQKKKRAPIKSGGTYVLPTSKILETQPFFKSKVKREDLEKKARDLQEILASYKIEGQMIDVLPGPIVTMFEFEPARGVKVSSVSNLSDDLAMKLRAESVRIIAPIPGRGAVGIEVPNKNRESVYYRDVYESDTNFSSKKLPLVLGNTTQGEGFTTDLAKMPHLLVAGATGAGKSVSLNAMICSLLFTKTPDEIKFILVDPKTVEFKPFEDIPHLLLPIITDLNRANFALKWAVNEMERRYQLLRELNVRNLDSFNEKLKSMSKTEIKELDKRHFLKNNPGQEMEEYPPFFKPLPYIVIVIDELGDLMLVAGKEVEISITRLAQKARASGMHLIVATQRPSTDVITGLIKANFPSRIAFQVASKIDSRIILDSRGDAETLLGNGDMLFLPPGASRICRVHGAYLSDKEVESVVEHWTEQGYPDYLDEEEINRIESPEEYGDVEEKVDALFDKAVQLAASTGQVSTSMIQRKLDIGYPRAAKIIDMMEAKNIVGPPNGSKPRDVYVNPI
jgi:S-DNA-T family DNA segregation ATPase FtsK/SpoIIIE